MAVRSSGQIILVLFAACFAEFAHAQLPFYTDDPAVTPNGTLHFEFFNEYDALQSAQYPNLRQNTANSKVNYGLPHNLELDLDAPYLAIFRAVGTQTSTGLGDVDMGIKWKIHQAGASSRLPTLGASLYIEFPTGNVRKELGSGLHDYWLNFIAQKPISETTRVNANLGYLFAGNTGTGVVGIESARGHVITGGVSLLHDFNSRLTLGGELYGGIPDNQGLSKSQLQAMLGGEYAIWKTLSVTFGLLGGKYVASPRIGGQIGFAVDIPHFLRGSNPSPANAN